jgi:hypothetical protein
MTQRTSRLAAKLFSALDRLTSPRVLAVVATMAVAVLGAVLAFRALFPEVA